MAFLCPTHKLELAISEQQLTILNQEQKVTIGICPMCQTHYINYVPLGNSTSFTLNNQRYQLLESLRIQFPPLAPQKVTPKQTVGKTETTFKTKHTTKKVNSLHGAKKQPELPKRVNKELKKTTPSERLLRHFLKSGGTATIEGDATPNISNKITLWVYRLKQPCLSHPTSVKATSVMVLEKQKQQWFPMLCLHCEKCNKYYVNSESFLLYTRKYGIPMVELKHSTSSEGAYQDWAEESILHFWGYNVNQTDDLSAKERQHRVRLAIDGEFIAKPQAIAFLEGLIRRHKNNPKYNLAVKKWEDDLWFLLNDSVKSSRIYAEHIIAQK